MENILFYNKKHHKYQYHIPSNNNFFYTIMHSLSLQLELDLKE